MSEYFEPTSFNTFELSSLSSMEDLDLTEVRGAEGRVDPLTTSSSPSDMLFKAKNSYSPLSLEGIFSCSSTEGSSEARLSEKPVFLKVKISHSFWSFFFPSVPPHPFLNPPAPSALLFFF